MTDSPGLNAYGYFAIAMDDCVLIVHSDCPHFIGLLELVFGAWKVPTVTDHQTTCYEVFVLRHTPIPDYAHQLGMRAHANGTFVTIQYDPSLNRFVRHGYFLQITESLASVWVEMSNTTVICNQGQMGRVVEVYSPCQTFNNIIDSYENDDAFRVVRHSVFLGLMEQGRHWLHAAAIANRGWCQLIVGDSRSVKTLTLLRLLLRDQTEIMTNGRALLKLTGAQISVNSYGEIVLLRRGHFSALEGLRERLYGDVEVDLSGEWDAPEDTKVPFFKNSLATALGRSECFAAIASGIIFPQLHLGQLQGPPPLNPIERATILRRNLVSSTTYAEYGWFVPEKHHLTNGEEELIGALMQVSHSVVWMGNDSILHRKRLD